MKLSTLPKEPGHIFMTMCVGILTGLVSFVLYKVAVSIVHYEHTLLVVEILAATIPGTFVLGCIVGGILDTLFGESEFSGTCPECDHTYRNFIAEYLHKRKCLPYITRSVGK